MYLWWCLNMEGGQLSKWNNVKQNNYQKISHECRKHTIFLKFKNRLIRERMTCGKTCVLSSIRPLPPFTSKKLVPLVGACKLYTHNPLSPFEACFTCWMQVKLRCFKLSLTCDIGHQLEQSSNQFIANR